MNVLDIADNLSRWRKHLKMTQAQLEQKAGLGHNTVSRIESRNIRSPQLGTIQKLATALSLSTEQLLYGRPPQRNATPPEGNSKARMLYELRELDEEMCEELYPVWKSLIELLMSRKGG